MPGANTMFGSALPSAIKLSTGVTVNVWAVLQLSPVDRNSTYDGETVALLVLLEVMLNLTVAVGLLRSTMVAV